MKITFETDVLCIAHHPTLPQFAVALVTGHVFAYTYTRERSHEVLWSTRRHKKACRAIAYSLDGATIVSAGADGIIKLASSATGKVLQKWSAAHGEEAINAVAWMNETVFCTADDAGVIKAWDAATQSTTTTTAMRTFAGTHVDYVSCLAPLDGKFVLSTSGDGTLAIHDLRANTTAKPGSDAAAAAELERDRKKALSRQSDDQEDDLTCCLLLKAHAKRQKILVGTASGVLLLFNRADIGDCTDRILPPIVSVRGKKEAGEEIGVECLAKVDEDTVIVGGTDGKVRLLSVLPNRWVRELGHFEHGEPIQDVIHADGLVLAASGTEIRSYNLSEDVDGQATNSRKEDEEEKDGDDSGDEFSDSDSDSEAEQLPKKKKVKKMMKKPAMQQKKKDTFFDDL